MLAKKRTENLKILCPFPFVLDFTALSQINVPMPFFVCAVRKHDEKIRKKEHDRGVMFLAENGKLNCEGL